MLLFLEKQPGDILHSDGIECWHHDFGVAELAIDRVVRHRVRPDDPLLLGFVPHVIVDQTLGWEVHFVRHHGSELLAELFSSLEGASATNGPGKGEDEQGLDGSFKLLDHFRCDLLQLTLVVFGKVAVKEAHQTLNNIVVDSWHGLRAILAHELQHWVHVLCE